MKNTETRDGREGFDCYIDSLVRAAISRGLKSFDQLLFSLPSVYPSVVLKTAERLCLSGELPEWKWKEVMFSVQQPPRQKREWYPELTLPIPHPLDYEWRFTEGTAQYLLELADALSAQQDTVIMFGVPSVFQRGLSKPDPKRRFMLIDANTPVLKQLSRIAQNAGIIACDILEAQVTDLELSAKVVIIDAPWYPSHLQAFLRAAIQVCSVGGHVLISLPPVGTRPGILKEREHLVEQAERAGLRLMDIHSLALSYASPPFERNALRAEGILSFPYNWRRGDFAHFTLETSSGLVPALPSIQRMPSITQWSEESIRGVRIRIRKQDVGGFADPALVSVIPGDILPSVSGRDQRRSLADVWTSGNRIYRCSGTHVLREVLKALSSNEDPSVKVADVLARRLTRQEEYLVALAREQVIDMIEKEEREYIRIEHET